MQPLLDFLNTPQGGFVAALVLSAACRALPTPTEKSNGFYTWLHSFAGLLMANFDKIGATKK
jgi:hypothetical protein